jgi:gamma-glutamyltranspeptidase/glutathione hydrolase
LKYFLTALFFLLFAVGSTLQSASPEPVHAKHGMVVAADTLAARVGVEILRSGGNAVDAAVAVGFALAVTYPSAGNIGGGGFMVIRFADGRSVTIDSREKAPSAASRTMYLDSAGNAVTKRSTYGHLSAGVPGSVNGYLLALEKYGTMKRTEILRPAIELAENGIPLHHRLAHWFEGMIDQFKPYPASMKVFTKNGIPYNAGEIWRQPDLAATLRRIEEKGSNGFYKGTTAQLIIDEMKRGNGLITQEDLDNYGSVIRPPVRGTYRGYEIISMGPPSSGGTALIHSLNILEGYSMSVYGANSSKSLHRMIETMRRTFADRVQFMGDPDMVKIPLNAMLSKQYADVRRSTIDTFKATPSSEISYGTPPPFESGQTTHYSIVDRFGNCVSVTTTLNGGFGSCVVVDGAGFLLNNEMDDFSSKTGTPNMYGLVGSEVNSIEPNKRMVSSMTPTIVVKENKPYLVLGAPGGTAIITTLIQVVVNIIDYRMDIQEAIDAPRIHHQWIPDKVTYERRGLPTDVVDNLRSLGHTMEMIQGMYCLVEGIMIDGDKGLYLGASDPRGFGGAIGY